MKMHHPNPVTLARLIVLIVLAALAASIITAITAPAFVLAGPILAVPALVLVGHYAQRSYQYPYR